MRGLSSKDTDATASRQSMLESELLFCELIWATVSQGGDSGVSVTPLDN